MSKDAPKDQRWSMTIGAGLVCAMIGAIFINALFCDAGTVNESDGSGWRLLIGGVLGLLFGIGVGCSD